MGFQAGRAFEHIDKLAYEIGPRLAGSRGDRLAAEYIRSQFSNLGLETQVHEFRFVDRQLRRKVMAFLFGVPFLLILFLPPSLSLLLWLTVLILWRLLGKLLPKRSSRNIVARLEAGEPKKTIALSAHFDSAPCRVGRRFALFIRLSFPPISISVLLILIAHALWEIEIWKLVWTLLAVYFAPLCVYLFRTGSTKRVSPGANDNASGVAVLLEVARALAESPPQDTRVIFIASGAEEQGLVGMKKIMKERVLPSGAVVLNLDGVGFGPQPYIIQGNGLLRKVRTSEKLNLVLSESIERTRLKPELWWVPFSRHDHLPPLKAGFDATTLTFDRPDGRRGWLVKVFRLRNARDRVCPHLHTEGDLPDRLEPKTIERTGEIVLNFVGAV
jgi:hypothetical protein